MVGSVTQGEEKKEYIRSDCRAEEMSRTNPLKMKNMDRLHVYIAIARTKFCNNTRRRVCGAATVWGADGVYPKL